MTLRLYNSITKDVEVFKPSNPDIVTMYTCGPTVYDYATIGNFRTYSLGDFLYRALLFNGYKVKYIMNLTDVGHLSGDNSGDADTGDDRIESAAEKEGRSAREITDYYIKDFFDSFKRLNLSRPEKFTRATDYIIEQIDLVRMLERKGFTYKTYEGIYFDTSKFKKYGELSGLTPKNIREGARVEPNPEKRNPTDFALWKLSDPKKKRWQEWDSPWGLGFPGWHLECSAMILRELGESIDIHLGGEDLKMIHHQNEIAQSECATGKPFVNYWIHGSFLQIDGGRMGKSLGNAYTLRDIQDKGFDPITLRYFYMTANYRSKLNFTWEAMQNAQNSLKRIYEIIEAYKESEDALPSEFYLSKFRDALNDDLNMPQAVAVMWEMLKSDIKESTKLVTLLRIDKVLGLRIEDYIGFEVPQKVLDMAQTREEYRKAGIWDKADQTRRAIEEMGFLVEDLSVGKFKVKRKI